MNASKDFLESEENQTANQEQDIQAIHNEILKSNFLPLLKLGIAIKDQKHVPSKLNHQQTSNYNSIYDYCDSFEMMQDFEEFTRFFLNSLYKISNSKSIILYLLDKNQAFYSILEQKNQVFISGIQKPLLHSIKTLIHHFKNRHYLVSNLQPLVYLPLIIYDRLIGFTQVSIDFFLDKKNQQQIIPFLWRTIQKNATILERLIIYEQGNCDPKTGLFNETAFQRDCYQTFVQKQEMPVQLTLIELKKISDQKTANTFGIFLVKEYSKQSHVYRITDNVFAILDRQQQIQQFTKKIKKINEQFGDNCSFAVAGITATNDIRSPKEWLQNAVMNLNSQNGL